MVAPAGPGGAPGAGRGARARDDRKCVYGAYVLEGDRTREHLPRRVSRELGRRRSSPCPTPMRLLKQRSKRVVTSEEEARLGEYGEVPL